MRHPLLSAVSDRALGRGRSVILYVDHQIPRPDEDSGPLRAHGLLRILRDLGHAVSVFTDDGNPRPHHLRQLAELDITVVPRGELMTASGPRGRMSSWRWSAPTSPPKSTPWKGQASASWVTGVTSPHSWTGGECSWRRSAMAPA